MCDLQGKELKRVAESLRQTLSPQQGLSYDTIDVTQTEQVNKWTRGIKQDFGQFDGAANIAGVFRMSPFGTLLQDTTDDDWKFTMETNITGVSASLFSPWLVIEC